MPWNKPYRPARNQRLSPDLYECANRVYFLTVRAYRNQTPFVDQRLNALVLRILWQEEARQGCVLYTYCLMPDHLHILISPACDGISALVFVNQFKGKSTNASWTVGWQGKLWQPRFYDHIVRREEDLRAIAEYILANPVRKHLVDSPEDWPWSGQLNPLPL